MSNENKTVAEVVKRVRRDCNSYPLPNAAGEKLKLVREIEEAHNREIGELKGERNGLLKANESLAADNTRLRDELKKKDAKIEQLEEKVVMRDCHCEDADSERMEAEDIANNLRAIVKELTDALDEDNKTECEQWCKCTCQHGDDKNGCETMCKKRALVKRAKEVLNGGQE